MESKTDNVLSEDNYVFLQDADADSLESAELWSRYIADASVIVAGISCGMNIMIITTLSYAKRKSHLKLVLSLAFADLLLAAFNILEKFVKFPIHWENLVELSVTFEFDGNISHSGLELGDSFLFVKEDSGHFLPREFDQGENKDQWISTDRERAYLDSNYSDTFVVEEQDNHTFKENMTLLPQTFIEHFLTKSSEFTQLDQTEYSQVHLVLGCLYLIPNMTNVLTMVFITIHLLVLIAKPLQQQIILSNRRVINIVLGIWGSATLLAGVFCGVLLTRTNMLKIAYLIQTAWLVIWYGTMACFLAMAILYCVILATLRRQRSIHASRMASTRKAAITAFIVVFSFAVLDLPFVWISVINHLIPAHKRINVDIKQVFRLLFVTNTIVDSLIYTIRLPEVAMGFKKIKNKMTYSRITGTEFGSELRSIGK